MSGSVSTIISDLLNGIDHAGGNFVEVLYKRIGLYLDPVFFSMLVIYVIWWGYSIMSAKSTATPLEAAERLAKAMFIYWLVTNWQPFADSLYTLVQKIPDILAQRIVKTISASTGAGGGTDVAGIPAMFDDLYTTTIKVVGQIYTGSLMDIFGGLLSIIIIIFTLLFIGVALAAIIAAKVMLFIVLALGPVWIILALFNYSYRFTDGFLTVCAQLVIQQVLIYGFLGFYFYMVTLSVNVAENGGGDDIAGKLSHVMPLLLVTLVGFYVLLQIPMIAAVLSGGAPLSTVGAYSGMMRSISGIGQTARGTYRAGRATYDRGVRPLGRAGESFMRQSTQGRRMLAAASIQREAAKNASSL